MTQIHFLGISADAIKADTLMPTDHFEQHLLIVLGVSFYYTGGSLKHRHQLHWHPQTMLIDFNEPFVRSGNNFTGYANFIGVDGEVIAIRLLKNRTDKRAIVTLQVATHQRIAAILTHGLAHYFPEAWHTDYAYFHRWFTRYLARTLALEALITKLEHRLTTAKTVLVGLFNRCRKISRAYERQLDQLMTTAYMIIKPHRVFNSMYVNEKYELLKATLDPPDNDPNRADLFEYRQQLFDQFHAIKTLFEQHQLPLYDTRERKRMADGELLWRPEDRDTYTQLGVLS